MEHLDKLFGRILQGRFVFAPHLFIESFTYVSMDLWIFTLYVDIPQHYLMAQIIPASATGGSAGSCIPLTCPHHCGGVFVAVWLFLAFP